MMDTPNVPRLPGLELLRVVGRGAFGEVWLARTVTGQYRAVKLVPLSGGDSGQQALGERAFRGVQAYLGHLPPGSTAALAVLHVDRDPDGRFLYYVMELADDVAEGRTIDPERYQALTLSEFRRRSEGQFVSADETIRIGRKLAEGLGALHAAGLVHRDIKPNNVVFIDGEPRLADIDLVRPSEASLSLGGALGYAPMEGPGRPTADVFSLARTLYVTVTGLSVGEFPRLPEDWDRRPDAAALRRLNAVLLRACERDPARRHQDGRELAEELRRLEQGEDVAETRAQHQGAQRRRSMATIMLGLLAVVLVVGVPFYNKWNRRGQFEEYRMWINRVALKPQQDSSAYTDQRFPSTVTGIEIPILKRQSEHPAFRSNVVSVDAFFRDSPISNILINPAGNRLAISDGANTDIYAVGEGRKTLVLTNFFNPCAYTVNDVLVGARRDDKFGISAVAWLGGQGSESFRSVPGWFPLGIRSGGEMVLLATVNKGEMEVADWNPMSEFDPANARKAVSILGISDNLSWSVLFDFGERYFANPNVFRIASLQFPTLVFLPQGSDEVFAFDMNLEPSGLELSFGRSSFLIPHSERGFPKNIPYLNNANATNRNLLNSVSWDLSTYWKLPGAISFADSPDNIWAVGGEGGMFRLMDGTCGRTLVSLGFNWMSVQHIAWDLSGRTIAAADSVAISVWRVSRPFPMPSNNAVNLFVSSDLPQVRGDKRWALESIDHGESFIASYFLSHLVGSDDYRWPTPISMSRARVLKKSEKQPLWCMNEEGEIVIFKEDMPISIESKSLRRFEQFGVRITNAFTRKVKSYGGTASEDGRRFVLHGDDLLAVWEVDGMTVRRLSETLHPNGSHFVEVASSFDSQQAVALAEDGSVLCVDLESGVARPLRRFAERAVTACFEPDTHRCFLGTAEGRLLRFDVTKEEPPELLDANFGFPAHMIAIPGEDRLLTAGPGEQLGVRRLSDGAPIVQLTHHGLALEPGRHNLKRLLYLNKKKRVVSVSEDGWLTEW